MPAPQRPDFAEPAPHPTLPRLRGRVGWGRRVRGLPRQHEAGRYGEPPLEFAHDARTFRRIVDLGVARIDVVGPVALRVHPPNRILIGRDDAVAADAKA